MVPTDSFLAALVSQNLGVRPIQFTLPSPAAQALGLMPYVVRQGLTGRLASEPVQPGKGEFVNVAAIDDPQIQSVTAPYIDVSLTKTLLADTFANRLPPARRVWSDAATRNMPAQYGWLEAALAVGEGWRGGAAEPNAHVRAAQLWFAIGS
jgi:hypothetical protein